MWPASAPDAIVLSRPIAFSPRSSPSPRLICASAPGLRRLRGAFLRLSVIDPSPSSVWPAGCRRSRGVVRAPDEHPFAVSSGRSWCGCGTGAIRMRFAFGLDSGRVADSNRVLVVFPSPFRHLTDDSSAPLLRFASPTRRLRSPLRRLPVAYPSPSPASRIGVVVVTVADLIECRIGCAPANACRRRPQPRTLKSAESYDFRRRRRLSAILRLLSSSRPPRPAATATLLSLAMRPRPVGRQGMRHNTRLACPFCCARFARFHFRLDYVWARSPAPSVVGYASRSGRSSPAARQAMRPSAASRKPATSGLARRSWSPASDSGRVPCTCQLGLSCRSLRTCLAHISSSRESYVRTAGRL